MVKEECVEDAVTDPIYKVVVERALADTPQTDAEITELAKEIVHKMIDNSDIAEDAYPDLRQRMHEAVERLDEYYPSQTETKTETQNSNLTFEKQTDEEYINNLPWTEKDCPWK